VLEIFQTNGQNQMESFAIFVCGRDGLKVFAHGNKRNGSGFYMVLLSLVLQCTHMKDKMQYNNNEGWFISVIFCLKGHSVITGEGGTY